MHRDRYVRLFMMLFATISLTACSTEFYRQEKVDMTIDMVLVGDNNMNLYKDKSHSLLINIYQLKNLDQLRMVGDINDFEKMKELFTGKIKSLSINSLILLPGRAKKVRLVAQKSCAYIVLVAGYYSASHRDDFVAIYPVSGYKRGLLGYQYGSLIEPEIYVRFGDRKIT